MKRKPTIGEQEIEYLRLYNRLLKHRNPDRAIELSEITGLLWMEGYRRPEEIERCITMIEALQDTHLEILHEQRENENA